ncbi:MAG: GNAT family N-acetyltransferase [Gemmatimonadaceae bacterium]
MSAITLRGARAGDVAQIAGLINGFAAEATMLPKTSWSIAQSLHDFVVATNEHGRVLACGAVQEYSPSLAEVASVAVARSEHGRGLGRMIVREVEALARARGIGELFALTTTPAFFTAMGYVPTDRARYPEKIRRDCIGCPRRAACVEVCVRAA